MNLLFFRNPAVALVAAVTLLTSLNFASVAHAKQARHHKSSHDDSSCCKSVKKRLKSAAKTLDSIKKHERNGCCEATPICQKTINKAGGMLILRESGNYALTHDVTGTIVVAADSVCIDLCCHTLNAGGRASAIMADGYEGLEVFNGRIINATDAAILIDNYSSVQLYNLTMSNNALDAIRQSNSIDLSVHDVDFIGDDSGERALLFDTCDNIAVNRCNASGFLSTLGAVIQFETCNAASMQDVDVTNCTKTTAADFIEFTPATALVSVNSSTGVDFVHVKANNNIFNNDVPVADQNNHWRTAEAIAFFSSTTCSLHQCETSNNTDIAGTLATADTEDFMLLLITCSGCTVTEHLSNNNSCTQPITYFKAIVSSDSNNIVYDGCQACNNFVAELNVLPFISELICIEIGNYYNSALVHDNIIRNCQANSNTVTRGGVGRTSFTNAGLVLGIVMGGRTDTIIDNCQANRNTMGDANPHTFVEGIVSNVILNARILNSNADNNTGGALAAGINFLTSSETRGPNVLVSNCSASSNGNFGMGVGNLDLLNNFNADAVIIDCICDKNGSQAGPAFGIFIAPVSGGTRNMLIKGCQIYDTGTTLSTTAVGINVPNATNVVIEDTNVYNTGNAPGNIAPTGHGILFTTCQDSKIIRTQLHGNKNAGVELVGTNTDIAIIECVAMHNDKGFEFAAGSTASCSLVQDSRALSNTTAGFVYAATPTPFTVTFIGNEAQCNGTNYDLGGNIIPRQSLDWSSGLFINLDGGTAALGSRYVNIDMVP